MSETEIKQTRNGVWLVDYEGRPHASKEKEDIDALLSGEEVKLTPGKMYGWVWVKRLNGETKVRKLLSEPVKESANVGLSESELIELKGLMLKANSMIQRM